MQLLQPQVAPTRAGTAVMLLEINFIKYSKIKLQSGVTEMSILLIAMARVRLAMGEENGNSQLPLN